MEDNITPRTLIRDYLHNVPTQERSTRRQRNLSAPQQTEEVDRNKRLSKSYTAEKISPMRTETQIDNMSRKPSPKDYRHLPRRNSRKTPVSQSVRKKAMIANFLQNETTADEPTPRTMIRGFLGQAEEETPLVQTRSQAHTNVSAIDDSIPVEKSLHQNESNQEDTFFQAYNSASQESRPSPKRLKRKRQEVSKEAFSQGVDKNLKERQKRKEQTPSENSRLLESVTEETLQESQFTFNDSVKSTLGRTRLNSEIVDSLRRSKKSAQKSHKEPSDNVSAASLRSGQSGEDDSFLKAYKTASQQDERRTSIRKSKRQRQAVNKDAFAEGISSARKQRPREHNQISSDMQSISEENEPQMLRKSLGENAQIVTAEVHISPPNLPDVGISKNAANVKDRLSKYDTESQTSGSGTDTLKKPIPLLSYDASVEGSEEDSEEEGHFQERSKNIQEKNTETVAEEQEDLGISPNDSFDANAQNVNASNNNEEQLNNSKYMQSNSVNNDSQSGERTGVAESQSLESTFSKDTHQQEIKSSKSYIHQPSNISTTMYQQSVNYSARSTQSLQKSSFGQHGDYSPLVTPVLPPGNPFVIPTPKPATKQPTIDTIFGAKATTTTAKASDKDKTTNKPIKKKTPPKKTKNVDKPLRLPASLTKSIAQHFFHGRISKDTLATIESVADDYFKNVSCDLEAFANHGDRTTIDARDVELLMKRQGFVTKNQSMFTLVEKYLPLEYQQEIIPVARSGNKVVPKDFH